MSCRPKLLILLAALTVVFAGRICLFSVPAKSCQAEDSQEKSSEVVSDFEKRNELIDQICKEY